MNVVYAVIGLLLSCAATCCGDEPQTGRGEVLGKVEEALLLRILDALESGLSFMEKEHKKINLDAVIGTRIVEGQLKVLLRNLNNREHVKVSDETVKKIEEVRTKADKVSGMAIPYIKENDSVYFNRIGNMLNKGFWSLDYPSRDINISLVVPPAFTREAFREVNSDDCIAELFGTSGKSTGKCRPSHRCIQLMTTPGYNRYSLSHEVFYLEIADATGCVPNAFRSELIHLLDGFCSNMLREAIDIQLANYPDQDQDLFMEQQALCGIVGYRQFFKADWVEKILSWQNPSFGCWSQHQLAGRRIKREELLLPDGCLCHRTSVAIAALSQYIRYVIELQV